MKFSVDPNIVAGYRRRAGEVMGAVSRLYDLARTARAERDALASTGRSRRQDGAHPVSKGGKPDELNWLSAAERSRYERLAAEIATLDADTAAAEGDGAHDQAIGRLIEDHLKAVTAARAVS